MNSAALGGALLGAAVGAAVLLAGRSARRSRRQLSGAGARASTSHRLAQLLRQAGYAALTPTQLLACSVGCAVVAFLGAMVVTASLPLSLAAAVFAAWGPVALVRERARRAVAPRRESWPDVVDNLASAVRAGLSLPEAVAQVGERGPEPLRPAFHDFATHYGATGRFGEALDELKEALADPVADRIVETLRLARDVGGTDLGRLLRTLSQFLREDARTRAELQTRQGWTVNAARVALAAPWFVLAVMSLHRGAVAAYNTAPGLVVLCAGGAVSVVAYRLMMRIARLPDDPRVLR